MEGEIWKKENGEPERWWIACRPLSFLLSFFPPSPLMILIYDDYFVMPMMTTGQHQIKTTKTCRDADKMFLYIAYLHLPLASPPSSPCSSFHPLFSLHPIPAPSPEEKQIVDWQKVFPPLRVAASLCAQCSAQDQIISTPLVNVRFACTMYMALMMCGWEMSVLLRPRDT